MSRKGIFAIYKGDSFIDMGTAEELAKKMGCKPEFIKYLSTPANLRRINKRTKSNSYLIAVKVGKEGDNFDNEEEKR